MIANSVQYSKDREGGGVKSGRKLLNPYNEYANFAYHVVCINIEKTNICLKSLFFFN